MDAAKDEPVWAERFNGTVDEVIVRALDVRLTSDENRSLREHPVRNTKAYELYLQAKAEIFGHGPGTERGMQLVAHTREIEGDTIPLRLLETAGKVERVRAGMAPDHSGLDEAELTARQAPEEDPERAYARATAILAFVAYERGEMAEAARQFNEASGMTRRMSTPCSGSSSPTRRRDRTLPHWPRLRGSAWCP